MTGERERLEFGFDDDFEPTENSDKTASLVVAEYVAGRTAAGGVTGNTERVDLGEMRRKPGESVEAFKARMVAEIKATLAG
jgi:hypothetical protein